MNGRVVRAISEHAPKAPPGRQSATRLRSAGGRPAAFGDAATRVRARADGATRDGEAEAEAEAVAALADCGAATA